jgi:hypothetical protein
LAPDGFGADAVAPKQPDRSRRRLKELSIAILLALAAIGSVTGAHVA